MSWSLPADAHHAAVAGGVCGRSRPTFGNVSSSLCVRPSNIGPHCTDSASLVHGDLSPTDTPTRPQGAHRPRAGATWAQTPLRRVEPAGANAGQRSRPADTPLLGPPRAVRSREPLSPSCARRGSQPDRNCPLPVTFAGPPRVGLGCLSSRCGGRYQRWRRKPQPHRSAPARAPRPRP